MPILTEREKQVIAVLTHPDRKKTRGKYDAPDVEQALNLGTLQVVEVIKDLEQRQLIESVQVVHHIREFRVPEYSWKVPANSDAELR